MKKLLVFILHISISQLVYSQFKESPISLYKTTQDFLNGKKWDGKAIAVIKEEHEKYLLLNQIIDSTLNKPLKQGFSTWAIEYNGEKYFNLAYSTDLNHNKLFVKFDVTGPYCAIFIDRNAPNLLKNSGTYYGGGLTGVLIKESAKWGKNWKDESGADVKILFVNTSVLLSGACSPGNYLTRTYLTQIAKRRGVDLDNTEEISFEKAKEIIAKLNKS